MYTISLVLSVMIALVSLVLMGRCRWYASLIPLFSAPLVNHFFNFIDGFNLWWFVASTLLSVLPLTTITHYKYTDKRARLGLCFSLMGVLNFIYVWLSIFTSPSYVPYSVSGGLLWVTILFTLLEDFHDYIKLRYSNFYSNGFINSFNW